MATNFGNNNNSSKAGTIMAYPRYLRESIVLGLKMLSPYCAAQHSSKTGNTNLDIEIAAPTKKLPDNVIKSLERIGWTLLDNGGWSCYEKGFDQRFNPSLIELTQLPILPNSNIT